MSRTIISIRTDRGSTSAPHPEHRSSTSRHASAGTTLRTHHHLTRHLRPRDPVHPKRPPPRIGDYQHELGIIDSGGNPRRDARPALPGRPRRTDP
ncbi:hypothetical protein AB0M95_38470 [Sphaerisporangium sp. NPDC051017]|uniref:hypothetical protein n=1 Tax=Sphaerisporangium sp. NPDC051017 TaxID=3154636 RepID=UPI00342AF3DB